MKSDDAILGDGERDMKIVAWNIEKLRHKSVLDRILFTCERPQADIFILAEADEQVHPNYRYCFQKFRLAEIQPV